MRRVGLLLLLTLCLTVAAPLLLRLHLLFGFPASPDLEGARLPTSFRRAAELRVAPPIYEVGGAVTEPIPLAQPAPEMPQRCYRPGFSATVLFETIIDSEGTVRAVHTLPTTASSPLLETAARQALTHWRYKPATLDGAPVSVYLTLHFTYRVR